MALDLIVVKPERASGSEITKGPETHVVGEDGLANHIWLDEVPSVGTVEITGKTEVAGTPANANEFRPYYVGQRLAGAVELHSSLEGDPVTVDEYEGTGSPYNPAIPNRIIPRLEGEHALTSAATIVIPLLETGLRQFYAELEHDADFELDGTPPAGVTFDLLVAPNVTGNGGPFTPTFDAADFEFGTDGAPTIPTTADKFVILGFLTRAGGKAYFMGMKTGHPV